MAKRFYDTGLVEQEWYMNLSPKHKALYLHLLCKCDIAGVFEVNYRMMSVYVNDTITEEDVFGSFGNRIIPLANSSSKGIIVDFIGFQCGGCLNQKVKAHQSIMKRLSELGLSVDDICKWSNHELKVETSEEKVGMREEETEQKKPEQKKSKKDIDMEIDVMFRDFWNMYPRKDAKQNASIKFHSVMSKISSSEKRTELLSMMIKSVNRSMNTEQWQKDGGKFIPMASTWINQKRWEDDVQGAEIWKRKEEEAKVADKLVSSLTI